MNQLRPELDRKRRDIMMWLASMEHIGGIDDGRWYSEMRRHFSAAFHCGENVVETMENRICPSANQSAASTATPVSVSVGR